jgi:membrane associated rhomboid family serine protease
MPYNERSYVTSRPFYSGGLPPGVKWLLIVNCGLFVVYFLVYSLGAGTGYGSLFRNLSLRPDEVLSLPPAFWQFVTYMFLHDPRGFAHILFNMLALWMFGTDLERSWGTRSFLKYYFLCGVGAGLCVVAANLFAGTLNTSTIGSSGAIYGLLLAFGILYPDRMVLLGFLFPIKAKYFVMIIGAIAFLSSIGASGSGVSHVAHLGGMIFGYLYLKKGRFRVDLVDVVSRRVQTWRRERARKKFQVYMAKQDGRRNHRIH